MRTGQGRAGRRENDTSGAREWKVDGWGFSLGLGISDHSRLGGGETDQFQMLCYQLLSAD
jgi:hypothetical protein